MSDFRKRVLIPVAIPIAAIGFIALMTFAFSRVLLAVPEAGSTILAMLLASMVLGVIAVIGATGTGLKRSQKVLSIAAGVAVLGAGVAGASLGVRTIELHGEAVHVKALDIAFDTQVIELPADTESVIEFENLDAGVPHDIDIFEDDTFTPPPLFDGEVFPGVATKEYDVPPLATGTYAFRCSIHPQMAGTVEVSGEGGHGGDQGGDAHGDVPSVTIGAEAVKFDTDLIELPADEETAIVFENLDQGVPHNVEIYPDDSFSGEPLFEGEVFPGIETKVYELDPIPAGTYAFRCVIHPTTMVGTAEFG